MTAPKHLRVADALRDLIEHGVDGDKLPSEAQLGEDHGVSRPTVRAAIAALVNEGLVRSEPGVGHFVRRIKRFQYRPQDDMGWRPPDATSGSFFERAEADGRVATQEIEVQIVRAPSYVAQRLGVPEGEFLVRRARLRKLDGVPLLINDSFYPLDVVQGTSVMEDDEIRPGVNQLLADLGHEQVRALDEIRVRMPDGEEIGRLDLLPGTPVAIHLVTGYTADDRPVRVVRNVLPGDRHVITFDRRSYESEQAAEGR